jgi:hypothetical protein
MDHTPLFDRGLDIRPSFRDVFAAPQKWFRGPAALFHPRPRDDMLHAMKIGWTATTGTRAVNSAAGYVPLERVWTSGQPMPAFGFERTSRWANIASAFILCKSLDDPGQCGEPFDGSGSFLEPPSIFGSPILELSIDTEIVPGAVRYWEATSKLLRRKSRRWTRLGILRATLQLPEGEVLSLGPISIPSPE